jgi:hypothetical protein
VVLLRAAHCGTRWGALKDKGNLVGIYGLLRNADIVARTYAEGQFRQQNAGKASWPPAGREILPATGAGFTGWTHPETHRVSLRDEWPQPHRTVRTSATKASARRIVGALASAKPCGCACARFSCYPASWTMGLRPFQQPVRCG